jgi:hypothetical protein
MIRLIEDVHLDIAQDSRRPKRHTSLFHGEPQWIHLRQHSKTGSGGSGTSVQETRKTKWQQLIVGEESVDYDEGSHQFIVTPVHGRGIGESFYFEDLPLKIKQAINSNRSGHHTQHTS